MVAFKNISIFESNHDRYLYSSKDIDKNNILYDYLHRNMANIHDVYSFMINYVLTWLVYRRKITVGYFYRISFG